MASTSSDPVPGSAVSDLRLWYSCAGVLVKIPPVNSQVYYFVQGHAEHASAAGTTVDMEMIEAVPHGILCRVQEVEYSADKDTNEVYTRILLKPVDEPIENDYTPENNAAGEYVSKKLTFSAASTRKFHVAKDYEKMIFGEDDTSGGILCKDIHDVSRIWSLIAGNKLSRGWGEFMTAKHLKQNDTVLFMRDTNKELRVGIRHAKPTGEKYASAADSDNIVAGAAMLAVTGEAFEVFYYPRVATTEFVVNAARVKAALDRFFSVESTIHENPGSIRFEMTVEDEGLLIHNRLVRGKILSARADDPARWPDSPWKRLQVTVEHRGSPAHYMRVSPWTVNIEVPEALQIPPVPSNTNPSGSGSGSGSRSKPTTTTEVIFKLNGQPIV